MNTMYGIDVSSNQPKDICVRVDYDFAIVKLGGNPKESGFKWDYVNPYVMHQADEAYIKCGCVGLYWFCYGLDDPTIEADFFVNQVKSLGYLKRAVLIIDYEGPALKMGRSWLKKFAKRVEEKAGYRPVLYAQGSAIVNQNLVALGYPIWCANYYKGSQKISGYDTSGMKIYVPEATMWQFTETGYLKGYSKPLDLNKFFGSKNTWRKLAGMKIVEQVAEPAKDNSVRYKIVASELNVRSSRSSRKPNIVGTLKKGSIVYLTDLKKNVYGNTWGKIASGTYKGRYIAVIFKGHVYAKKG